MTENCMSERRVYVSIAGGIELRVENKPVMFDYFSCFPVFLFATVCPGDWKLLVVCPRQHGSGQSLDD